MHTYFVNQLLETRGGARDERGKLFKIKWNDGTITWEPLNSLIYDDKYLDELENVLCEYRKIANEYPSVKRLCLTCCKDTIPGKLFCATKQCKWMRRRVRDITQ